MVYRLLVDGVEIIENINIKKYCLEADNRIREQIIKHYLDDEGANEVIIETAADEVRRVCKEE